MSESRDVRAVPVQESRRRRGSRLLGWMLVPIGLVVLADNSFAKTDESKQEAIEQRRVQDPGPVGNIRWILETSSGVQFQLVQRVPDQTRSFYVGRGFPLEQADRYASACVFQTIVKNNTEKKAVELNLGEWSVLVGGNRRDLRLTSQWQELWERSGVPKAARIAFQWSQFPTFHALKPGDWFQGMIATQVAEGERFKLKIVWYEDGKRRDAKFVGLECAEDRRLTK